MVGSGQAYIKPVLNVTSLKQADLTSQSKLDSIVVNASVVPVTASTDAQSYALGQVGAVQYACLDSLWTKESGWRVNASNPSGAYGIPQSLPASKMASFGADYLTNPITQVEWGLSYIGAVYGTPCSAWAHSVAFNWY